MIGIRWLSAGIYGRDIIEADRLQTLDILRRHTLMQCVVRTDMTAIDRSYKFDRFVVVYHLRSRKYSVRIIVSVEVGELVVLPSSIKLFKGADWLERELWDMFGLCFSGHSNLRRILSDYGHEGHSLRKDFPTSGYSEIRYDEALKRVVLEPVERSSSF